MRGGRNKEAPSHNGRGHTCMQTTGVQTTGVQRPRRPHRATVSAPCTAALCACCWRWVRRRGGGKSQGSAQITVPAPISAVCRPPRDHGRRTLRPRRRPCQPRPPLFCALHAGLCVPSTRPGMPTAGMRSTCMWCRDRRPCCRPCRTSLHAPLAHWQHICPPADARARKRPRTCSAF